MFLLHIIFITASDPHFPVAAAFKYFIKLSVGGGSTISDDLKGGEHMTPEHWKLKLLEYGIFIFIFIYLFIFYFHPILFFLPLSLVSRNA